MLIRRIKAAVLAGVVLVMMTAFAVHAQDVPKISKEELRAELEKPDVTIIDVRTDHDWITSEWKIKGALREEPQKVEEWIGKYPKGKKIVLYCA